MSAIVSEIKDTLNVLPMNSSPSFFNGDLGCLLFLITYNEMNGINDETLLPRMETVIDDALRKDNPFLLHGLSGLGWFLHYLVIKNLLDKTDVEELLLQLDEVCYESAITAFKNNDHDFLSGGIGNAIYLLSRYNENTDIKNYLETIVTELENTGRLSPDGIYWIENENEFYSPDSTVLMGLAHGSASKIAFFSRLITHDIAKEKSTALLKSSLSFLYSKRSKNENSISRYPTSIVHGKNDGGSRLAWCHGDLGISIALLQAGKALKDDTIINDAIATGLHTIKRKSEAETGIVDAGFCHGMAGVAHMYNHMYHHTGVKDFKEAADYWIGKIYEVAIKKTDLKGLSAWDNYNKAWEWNTGLLLGLSGIGLVLLAHLYAGKSDWDSCMLLS